MRETKILRGDYEQKMKSYVRGTKSKEEPKKIGKDTEVIIIKQSES